MVVTPENAPKPCCEYEQVPKNKAEAAQMGRKMSPRHRQRVAAYLLDRDKQADN